MLATLPAPFGEITIETCELGVSACGTWHGAGAGRGDDSAAARAHLEATRAALREYLAGNRCGFDDLSLAPHGTAFQLAVWRALCELPYASTVSYAALAARLQRPRAVRAVGQANARNPIGILQPCHRVVGARGALVGFAGGLPMKRWLLEHEARVAAAAAAATATAAAPHSTPLGAALLGAACG
jgi:methylated-DNA-[protein]-cysteine S-methyltransferase